MNEEDESRKMWNWCEKCRAEAARKSDRNMMDDEDVGSECSDVESSVGELASDLAADGDGGRLHDLGGCAGEALLAGKPEATGAGKRHGDEHLMRGGDRSEA